MSKKGGITGEGDYRYSAAFHPYAVDALPKPIATDVFTVMHAETDRKQYFCVEHVELDKETGKVTLHRIPLAEWPEWAIELRKQVHGQ